MRIARIAVAVAALAVLLAAPFINMLAFLGGAHWLAAYAVVAAMGLMAAALAVALTVALFRLIGPKRTRFVAQIVAAVIGAAFVIGLQISAILSYGSLSRAALLQSHWLVARAPDLGNALWLPARAALGDPLALITVVVVSLALIGAAIAIFSVALRRPCDRRRRRLAGAGAPAPPVAGLPPRCAGARAAAARNGRCSSAIPG